MRDRVFGIETEYALIWHRRSRLEDGRPTNLELYRRFEGALLARVRTLPHGFSWLRQKGGRFLENGASFPSSALPGGPGAVGINNAGDWVVCYGRSASVGTRAAYTNTHRFD